MLKRRSRRTRIRSVIRRAAGRATPGALARADQRALRLMRTRGHGPLQDAVMRGFGAAGEWAGVWSAVGAGAALADRDRRGRWLVAAALGPAAIGVNYAVKVVVGRERPLITGHPPLARAPSKLSFPSAHATSSFAAATAIGRVEPRARPAVNALALGICASRPYLGMHYPSDVIAGAAIGLVLGRIVPGLDRAATEERLVDLVAGAPGSPVAGNGAGPAPSSAAAGGREPGVSA